MLEIEEKLVDGAQEIEDKLDGDKKKEKYDFAAMIVEKELELIKTEWKVCVRTHVRVCRLGRFY